MFDGTVEQYETIAIGLEGEILKLTRAAVEAHQTACLAKDAGKLVHNATVDTAVVMLCSLTGQNHVPQADLVVTKEVVETAGKATLHSSAT